MFGDGTDFSIGWINFIIYAIILVFAIWVLSTFLKSKIGKKIIYKIEPITDWYSGLSFGLRKFLRVVFYFVYIAACLALMVYISS